MRIEDIQRMAHDILEKGKTRERAKISVMARALRRVREEGKDECIVHRRFLGQ